MAGTNLIYPKFKQPHLTRETAGGTSLSSSAAMCLCVPYSLPFHRHYTATKKICNISSSQNTFTKSHNNFFRYHRLVSANTSPYLPFCHVCAIDTHQRKCPTKNGFNASRSLRAKASANALVVQQDDIVNKICKAIEEDQWECLQENFMNSMAQDLNPDAVVKVLNIQTDAQNALRFFQWADKQEGYEHNTNAYFTMIEILGRAKMFTELQFLLQKMQTQGCEITRSMLHSLVMSYGRSGRLKESLEAFNSMKEMGYEPGLIDTAYNSVLVALVKNKKLDMAENLFFQMVHSGVSCNILTYTSMIECFFLKEKVRDAMKLLYDMIQNKDVPDVVTYTTVISALCKRKMIDRKSVV